MVVWTTHPDRPPFMLVDGALQIKSPDEETIQKMVEMAGRLRARVVGEVYPLDPPDQQACIGGQDIISTLPNHGELNDHLNWKVNSQ